MMKKIMFFRPMYYIGGTEIAILSLVKNLKGYDIYIGYTDDTSDKALLKQYEKYAKVIKIDENFNEEMDTLILCSPYVSALDINDKVIRNKTILWFHHFGEREKSIFTNDLFYKTVDEVIVVSKTCKQLMMQQEYAKKLKGKIKVIYNIIDEKDIIEKSNVKIEIDTNHQLNLVSVGRICYEKGFDRQLELARLLKEHNVDFKWYIIGGNYYKNVENEIKTKYEHLNSNFVFTGVLSNPYNIIKQCDYLVLLSNEETWGLVLTEAKILGVPCIVTDFEVAFEQIKDDKTGIILRRDNTDSYEEKIDIIVNNKKIYKKNLRNFQWSNDKTIENWNKIL